MPEKAAFFHFYSAIILIPCEISRLAQPFPYAAYGRLARDPPAIGGKLQTASPRSWLEEVQQHYIRTLLHSFEDNFTAILRNVEVPNVEVGSEMS